PGRSANGAAALDAAAQNLSREEQKRLKREQAEKRNALHKEIKPLQSKYDALEKELTSVLEKQGLAEAQLADPEIYADHGKAAELLKSFEACKKRGEDIFEEMTALDERMEAVRARWNTDD
ncbi:ABC transporter ATP-binding protein, partial [Desulfovibrio sp. 1214_IL3152]